MKKIYVFKTTNGQIKISDVLPLDAKVYARVADEKSTISTALLFDKYDFKKKKEN